jgi:hypothetical protein
MAQDWGFGLAGAWATPLFLIVLALIAGVVIWFVARRIGVTPQRELELELIRREMLDECFAKGEMFREDCEGHCGDCCMRARHLARLHLRLRRRSTFLESLTHAFLGLSLSLSTR